jgi:manganese/zinc/iron transport system substrate-binding protein
MRISLLFSAIFAVLLAGCQPNSSSSGKLRVVCTTSMIADAVGQIGGNFVEVECLMGPGVDPHRYTASAGDIQKLARAKVIFYHGLHLEGKMGDVLEKTRNGQTTVAVTAPIPIAKLRAGDEGANSPPDPHVWFDPQLWVECLGPIEKALIEADPSHRQEYESAAAQYRTQMLEVDRELEAIANTLPKERRKLVTSHDAFGYFGQRYGFEVKGLQGISTASEISTQDVSDLAKFLVHNRITAVFTETSVPSRGLLAVLAALKDKNTNPSGHTVTLLGESAALYSDALGEPGSPGETYFGMIRHNMNTIVKSLKAQP